MAGAPLRSLLRHVCRRVAAPAAGGHSDSVLLASFLACRDATAFELLVWRHGAMVLNLCRRLLGREHDAEDAFQATFLTMVRRAGSISKHQSLGSWLYKVALRVAREAKAGAARRGRHERPGAEAVALARTGEPVDEAVRRELGCLLDEEVSRLPEKYRAPFILCYLEGVTYDEASRQLGWPKGTVAVRLLRGRALLRRRLARRGLSLSAGGLAAALAQPPVIAALPVALVAAAVRCVTAGDAAVSARVAALTEGVIRTMFGKQLKRGTALVLAAALAATAGVLAYPGAQAHTPQGQSQDVPPAHAAPKPAGGERPAGVDQYGDPLPPGALARMGTTRFRVGEWVVQVAYSPDGKFVAARDRYGSLSLWEADTGKLVRRVQLPQGSIQGLALFPQGKSLAITQRRDLSLYLWDFASGREAAAFQPRADGGSFTLPSAGGFGRMVAFTSLAASTDGKLLAGVRSAGPVIRGGQPTRQICIWELATGKPLQQLFELRRFDAHVDPHGFLLFSPDGKMLAGADEDKALRFWETGTGKERHDLKVALNPQSGYYPPLAFAPDGKLLVVEWSEQRLHVIDPAGGREVRALRGSKEWATRVAISPDGRTLATAGRDMQIRLWDVAGGKEVRQLRGHCSLIVSLAFAPDGTRLVSSAWDNTVRLWDVARGREIRLGTGHDDAILALALARDGNSLVTGGADGTARFWDAATGREQRVHRSPSEGVTAVAFSPDGRWIAWGGNWADRAIVLSDAATGQVVHRLQGHEQAIVARGLAFSVDSKALLSGSEDQTVRLWDVATGTQRHIFKGHRSAVHCVAFSPDGKTIASAGSTGLDSGIRLWDVATGSELRVLKGQKALAVALAFSPNGKLLASAGSARAPSDGFTKFGLEAEPGSASAGYAEAIHLWDVATGKTLCRLSGTPSRSFGNERSVKSLSFSPDGKMLASGERDHPVVLYEVATGKVRRLLAGHQGEVGAVAFSRDGTVLASAGGELTAVVWDLSGRLGEDVPRRNQLEPQELTALWSELSGEDAARAYRAILILAAVPKQSVPFLRERLQPVAAADDPVRRRLVADLDRADFQARQKAMAELERLGWGAEPTLRKALGEQPPLEVRRRIEQLLAKLSGKERLAERVREQRALEVLERVGSAEAQRHLEALADGAPEAGLTQGARAALQSLTRRRAAP
jgi:RNA polymerase sigma factor (sigma-70 family)